MKCIVCDRCGEIIKDLKRHRVVTLARPLKPDVCGKAPHRGNDPQANDIFWEKELCSNCVDELEAFMEPKGTGGGDDTPTEEPGGNTPTEEPGGETTEEPDEGATE